MASRTVPDEPIVASAKFIHRSRYGNQLLSFVNHRLTVTRDVECHVLQHGHKHCGYLGTS